MAAFHAIHAAEHNIAFRHSRLGSLGREEKTCESREQRLFRLVIRLRKTSIIDAVTMHVDDGVTVSVTFAEKRIARDTGTGLIRH